MKIESSHISMASSHAYESHVSVKKETLLQVSVDGNHTNKLAAVYDGSGASVTVKTDKQSQQQKPSQEKSDASQTLEELCPSASSTFDIESSLEEIRKKLKESVLNAMLNILNGKPKHLDPLNIGEYKRGNVLDLRTSATKEAAIRVQTFGAVRTDAAPGTTSAGTLWRRINAESVTRSESESTTFQTQGFAVTEDGRSFHIDVALNMSRSFTASYESFTSEQVVMTDPLIINLDSGVTSLTDTKFEFDLDSDGQQETISFAGPGSGFLALDANENGVIDDGSELFGTKSGDGFGDLSAYDGDGNGWIDENDAVYSKLRVWTKDAQGHDKLTNLKEANVGAIYLGSADTEFSLNDTATNQTHGVIRKTGIYLKETGGVGTLSHVDLSC